MSGTHTLDCLDELTHQVLFNSLNAIPVVAHKSLLVPLLCCLVDPNLRHLMRTFHNLSEPARLGLRSLVASASSWGVFLSPLWSPAVTQCLPGWGPGAHRLSV